MEVAFADSSDTSVLLLLLLFLSEPIRGMVSVRDKRVGLLDSEGKRQRARHNDDIAT